MNGVFQLKRYRRLPLNGGGRRPEPSPVSKLTRLIAPFCDSKRAAPESVGSTAKTKPPPPPRLIQSLTAGPNRLRVALGDPQLWLSCRPPYTEYGLRLSTAT